MSVRRAEFNRVHPPKTVIVSVFTPNVSVLITHTFPGAFSSHSFGVGNLSHRHTEGVTANPPTRTCAVSGDDDEGGRFTRRTTLDQGGAKDLYETVNRKWLVGLLPW